MILHFDNVSFAYPTHPIFENISLEVQKGEFLSILGPNGCGKSTLLKLIDKIISPQKGSIFIKKKPLQSLSRREIARIIGYVPQGINWLFPFTVMEIVLMGRIPFHDGYGFDREADIDIALEAMKSVDVLHIADRPITGVSGGEQQRTLIARALAQQPEILLLDEPNAYLDIAHQIEIFQILRELNDQGKITLISVSHDLNLASTYSKRILLLGSNQATKTPERKSASRIIAIGNPKDVMTSLNIEEVFSAPVLVDEHPIRGTPRITLHNSN